MLTLAIWSLYVNLLHCGKKMLTLINLLAEAVIKNAVLENGTIIFYI